MVLTDPYTLTSEQLNNLATSGLVKQKQLLAKQQKPKEILKFDVEPSPVELKQTADIKQQTSANPAFQNNQPIGKQEGFSLLQTN